VLGAKKSGMTSVQIVKDSHRQDTPDSGLEEPDYIISELSQLLELKI